MLYALGFVFLFTIGGLINLLALPLKTTICEKLLIIMISWYFLIFKIKDYNFEQFAGNLLILCNDIIDTPETSSSP